MESSTVYGIKELCDQIIGFLGPAKVFRRTSIEWQPVKPGQARPWNRALQTADVVAAACGRGLSC
jgi:hypothetical protein